MVLGILYPFINDLGESAMKKTINRLLPILFAGMIFYSGCAKQEVVKNDEPLVPAVAKSAAASAQKTVVS